MHTDPDILLVDEVLAVGDEQFQQKCIDKIKNSNEEGRTIASSSATRWARSSRCAIGSS